MTVSVAMAAYNGSRYIGEQLDSIIPQLSESDEIIVSLDPSTDNTREIILDYSLKDARIKLVDGKGDGLMKNFENAIAHCKNDIIFLCDQDDVWHSDKVSSVLRAFDTPDVMLVLHNAEITDGNLIITEPSFFASHNTKTGFLRNIIRNSYIGCCMAFRKSVVSSIIPFPENLPMHDQWIGLVCEKKGKISLVERPLIMYRRHEDNVSSMQHSAFGQMIKWRLNLIKALIGSGKNDNQ